MVNVPIIFITSTTTGSPFRPLDDSTAHVLLSFLGPLDVWSFAFFNALSIWQFGLVCPWRPQWWKTWFVLGPLYDLGRDFPLASALTTDWLWGLFNTCWSAAFLALSSFAFSIVGATTTGSLVFINFTSLEIFIVELLSPVYPNPILSEKCFWWEKTLSSFFVDTRSILTFAWTTSSSRNLILV